MRTKIASMVALSAALAIGMIAFTAGIAGAHATISYDCNTVTVDFTQFTPGSPSTATITVNGTDHDFEWTATSPEYVFTATVPYVSHSGDPDVVVNVTWQGPSAPGTASQTFSTESCPAPPTTTTTTTTTTPPTTTTAPPSVSPSDATRTVAAVAVVASPAFTG